MLKLVNGADGVDFGQDLFLDNDTAENQNPDMLVLGGTERAAENAEFLAGLAERFDPIAPRHPGFGRSPQPAWCTSVADIADIYQAWLEDTERTNVTLVGLQFGGWVALELAVRRLPAITRLVLVDSVGVKLGGTTDRDFVDVFATERAEVERRMYHDPARRLGDLETASERDVLEVMRNEEALARYGWDHYLHNPRLRRGLRRINVPTLVVWGEQDGIVSPDYGRRLAAEIPGACFELVPGAGHRAQVDRPGDVARLVVEFDA